MKRIRHVNFDGGDIGEGSAFLIADPVSPYAWFGLWFNFWQKLFIFKPPKFWLMLCRHEFEKNIYRDEWYGNRCKKCGISVYLDGSSSEMGWVA